MPGITKVARKDQSTDIVRTISEMAKRYCKDERTIILCTIPANADMATSEALRFSSELDPNG